MLLVYLSVSGCAEPGSVAGGRAAWGSTVQSAFSW